MIVACGARSRGAAPDVFPDPAQDLGARGVPVEHRIARTTGRLDPVPAEFQDPVRKRAGAQNVRQVPPVQPVADDEDVIVRLRDGSTAARVLESGASESKGERSPRVHQKRGREHGENGQNDETLVIRGWKDSRFTTDAGENEGELSEASEGGGDRDRHASGPVEGEDCNEDDDRLQDDEAEARGHVVLDLVRGHRKLPRSLAPRVLQGKPGVIGRDVQTIPLRQIAVEIRRQATGGEAAIVVTNGVEYPRRHDRFGRQQFDGRHVVHSMPVRSRITFAKSGC